MRSREGSHLADMKQSDGLEDTPLALSQAHEARLLQAGRMLGGIVHEIKNPLAVIQGYAQLVLDRCQDEDDRHDLASVLQESRRLGALVEDMLSFLRRGSDAVEDVDLRRVVEATLNLCTHSMRQARVTVVASLPDITPLVRGQHGAYMQVLINLLNNARESLEQHDVVDRSISLSLVQGDPGRTILTVSDNGPALPADCAQAVFDPFYTTKQEGKGVGLGLALCRDILTRHGATISLEPPTGPIGVTFRVDLPQVRSVT